MPSPFDSALASAITAYVRAERRAGTLSMSLACLKQCVRPPSHLLDGAPRGGNVPWQYAERFAAVLSTLPRNVRSFVTP